MKKSTIIKSLFVSVIFGLFVTSCSNIFEQNPQNNQNNDISENIEVLNGNMGVKLFVPDYYTLLKNGSERIIAPGTQKIKLSFMKNNIWTDWGTLNLSDATEVKDIEGAPNNFPGKIYTFSFTKIPSALYQKNELKISLLNENDVELTSGTNSVPVSILQGETTQAVFYTLPLVDTDFSSSLKTGEMKFAMQTIKKGCTYTIKVVVGEDNKYPDLVLFNSNGTFNSFYKIDSEEDATIKISEAKENDIKYIGVWASEDDILEYKLDIDYEYTASDVTNIEEFNEKGFEGEIEKSSGITIKSESGINGGNAIYVDYKSLRDNTKTMSLNLALKTESLLKFAIKTDITDQFDGTVELYIDDVLTDSYTGKNLSWSNVSYLLEKGIHKVEWKFVGVDSGYTSGITNSVYLDKLSLEEFIIPTTFDGFIENGEIKSEFFCSQGIEIVENSGVDGDSALYVDFKPLEDNTKNIYSVIDVQSSSVLKFAIKTDITDQFDGTVELYIDDVLTDSYTGKNLSWSNVSYLLEKGIHKVEWKFVGVDSRYTSGITNSVYLDKLSLEEFIIPTTFDGFIENGEIKSDFFYGQGIEIVENSGVDGDSALYVDFKPLKDNTRNIYSVIDVQSSSVLKFAIKTDITDQFDGTVELYIDDVLTDSYTGENLPWSNVSYLLEKGIHKVEWKFVGVDSRYTDGITNSVYLDKLSLKEYIIPTTFDGFIENGEIKSDFFCGQGIEIVENSGVDGDSALYVDFKPLKDNTRNIYSVIDVQSSSVLKFAIKTDIYDQNDGTVELYIDDVLTDSYTGMNLPWSNVSYLLEKGIHKVEWKFVGVDYRYTSGITNSVYLDKLSLEEFIIPTTLSEDFDDEFDSLLWALKGLSAEVIDKDEKLSKWVQYGNAIKDTHNKIVKLCDFIDSSHFGISSLKLTAINVEQESALSFDYKTDVYDDSDISVYVDGIKIDEVFSGIGQIWRTYSIILQPGIHSVEWFIGKNKTGNYGAGDILNALYLDNITLAPNTVSFVEVYPKGLQETYVNGLKLNFTAKALRSDGTEIFGKPTMFTTTNGSIDENGVFTPGSLSGTYSVTATIDGISGSNETVKVHGENYLSDSVTIGDATFTGASTEYNVSSIEKVHPSSADGFFVLKGNLTNSLYIKVKKDELETYYIVESGDVYQRIWLRFGSGNHTVTVYNAPNVQRFDPQDENYVGDIKGFGQLTQLVEFTVNNANTEFSNNATWLMPSYICQTDDFIVSNVANDIKASLPLDATTGDILREIHDWQIHHQYYDNVSLNHSSRRKTQDAVHVIKYNMSVCEGYANLFTALERWFGIQGKFISSQGLNHGWNNTYYDNDWLLVDTTWDDPAESGDDYCDIAPYSENYTYFLLTESQDSQTRRSHNSDKTVEYRSIMSAPTSNKPKMRGMPDGWY